MAIYVAYEPIVHQDAAAPQTWGYVASISQAADHISAVLPNVDLVQGTDSQIPMQVKVYVANYGETETNWYGRWDDSNRHT